MDSGKGVPVWDAFRDFWNHLIQLFSFQPATNSLESLSSSQNQQHQQEVQPIPTVLLYGTTTAEEHYNQVYTWLTTLSQVREEWKIQYKNTLEDDTIHKSNNSNKYEEDKRYQNWIAQHLLFRMGFQYKVCTLVETDSLSSQDIPPSVERKVEEDIKKPSDIDIESAPQCIEEKDRTNDCPEDHASPDLHDIPTTHASPYIPVSMDSFPSFASSFSSSCYSSTTSLSSITSPSSSTNDTLRTRLVHIQSNTIITEENRRQFIADGDMYEEMANLCQEYAQLVMSQEGSLQWTLISEPREDLSETTTTTNPTSYDPVLALMYSHPSNTSTFIISTGKGKVKAGIFSRRHLITSSIEVSTAWTFIREARKRNMNLVLLDPNARGDIHGMQTFTETMNRLFASQNVGESRIIGELPYYILSHSASGAQLVRYLMEKSCPCPTLPRAIVFTDSTHNIQWLRQNIQLYDWLQSSHCLYIRSSNPHDEGWEEKKAGDECRVDSFWQHRFGTIQTMWAGTKDHCLSNWEARESIWSHFDQFQDPGTMCSTPQSDI